jgi:segregation and condensation protein B
LAKHSTLTFKPTLIYALSAYGSGLFCLSETIIPHDSKCMNDALKQILEAAILASHQPLTIEQLSELFDEATRPTHNDLAQCLESLSADCDVRGVELVEVASGFRYQIKTSVYAQVGRLWTERQSKYSRALLETLSLIAYRQPITRPEIEAVRGVAVSSQIIRTLEEREWIRVVGHREVPGRPALFGTTRAFLDYFKLKSLEDLPTLSEIKDLDEMAPELDFSGATQLHVHSSEVQAEVTDSTENHDAQSQADIAPDLSAAQSNTVEVEEVEAVDENSNTIESEPKPSAEEFDLNVLPSPNGSDPSELAELQNEHTDEHIGESNP